MSGETLSRREGEGPTADQLALIRLGLKNGTPKKDLCAILQVARSTLYRWLDQVKASEVADTVSIKPKTRTKPKPGGPGPSDDDFGKTAAQLKREAKIAERRARRDAAIAAEQAEGVYPATNAGVLAAIDSGATSITIGDRVATAATVDGDTPPWEVGGDVFKANMRALSPAGRELVEEFRSLKILGVETAVQAKPVGEAAMHLALKFLNDSYNEAQCDPAMAAAWANVLGKVKGLVEVSANLAGLLLPKGITVNANNINMGAQTNIKLDTPEGRAALADALALPAPEMEKLSARIRGAADAITNEKVTIDAEFTEHSAETND